MTLEVTCTGMARGAPPDPCVVVIFGVAGDLARHTLIPSLYDLGCQGLLPEPFAIVGFARGEWDDEAFREEMRDIVRRKRPFRQAQWQKFARGLSYVQGDFTSPASEAYASLREKITKVQAARHIPDNLLFHLSTPPSFYGEIAQKLAEASLLHSDYGWRRLIIEKPFGDDEASARALDRQLLRLIDEEQLYRIDHFLGKETVQNMLVFRFANPGFEPIWNRHYIDHVQITAAESDGIGTRAGYYETAGVVRDMLQNHLLQLLCITAMEPPVAYDGISLFGIKKPPSAYEWLLLDAMLGNQTLFPRSDWIYKAWSIVDPVVKHWESAPPNDLPNYPAGSWGPAAADVLLKRDGREWYTA